MDKSVAVKKLSKILGKGFGYRINPKALKREEREKAHLEMKAAVADRNKARDELENRRLAILASDQEYQTLKAAKMAAQKNVDRLSYAVHYQPITVGVSNGMFFIVKAEGDNWDEVLKKLTA